MAGNLWLQRHVNDLKIGFVFLTRLTFKLERPVEKGILSQALWTAPIVGAAVGLVGASVYGIGHYLHLPPLPAAVLAVTATVAVTGALHEDGLADVADGFGGGATRERKLEIMRDSRIGTYGVCALMLSFMLRVSALMSLGDPVLVTFVLLAAHAAARAPMPAFMRLIPAARTDGLSSDGGRGRPATAITAIVLGFVALLVGLGLAAGFVALILLCSCFGFMAWLRRRQIGGQTGDVLGALEQLGEIAVLLVAEAGANALH
jgi:adenosylcobinamide-GDP ribazoletransferase